MQSGRDRFIAQSNAGGRGLFGLGLVLPRPRGVEIHHWGVVVLLVGLGGQHLRISELLCKIDDIPHYKHSSSGKNSQVLRAVLCAAEVRERRVLG